ncbi:hypothetical protein CTI12_AA075170 [Artemisia annua]|uniref:Uncharacterized protein n=1 Tax=Artemisia annua TaxID=35608 RepID=A0A2U1Q3Z8_ARTAN|nr:hypothetical protein CTI12_AA075170 [Artemisia annua]
MYCLPWLERGYQDKFNKSLDYKSLGVKDIKQLVVKMGNKGMVLFFKGRDSEEEYVMSARMVEIRQKVFLKDKVEKLLNMYGGKIAFESFEDLYEDQFKLFMDYDYYALTDLIIFVKS